MHPPDPKPGDIVVTSDQLFAKMDEFGGQLNGVQVDLREIKTEIKDLADHEARLRMLEADRSIGKDVGEHKTKLADLESRLRTIERKLWAAVGGAGVLAGAITVGARLLIGV